MGQAFLTLDSRGLRLEFASDALTFTIPGKPVPWQRVQRNRHGSTYVPERTREYEKLAGLCALAARPAWWPMDAAYTLVLRIYGARSNADMSNCLKSVEDGCNGILWTDDKQVHAPFPVRMPKDASGPRVEASVWVMES